MGWWKIKNVATGQIDWTSPVVAPLPDEPPFEDEELKKAWDEDRKLGGGFINAIPGKSTIENYYNGDGPADLITFALNRVEVLLSFEGQNVTKKVLEPLFFDGTGYKSAEYIQQDISWDSFKKAIQQSDDIQIIVGLTWLIIRKEYKEAWKREPYDEELRAVFNFCTNNRYKGK